MRLNQRIKGMGIAYFLSMIRAALPVLFLLLSFSFTAMAEERCNSVFLNPLPFQAVDSLEKTESFILQLITREPDIDHILKATIDTQFAKKSNWFEEDAFFFLLHLVNKNKLPVSGKYFKGLELQRARKLIQQENEAFGLLSRNELNQKQRDDKIRSLLLGTDPNNPDLIASWQVNNVEEVKHYGDFFYRRKRANTLHFIMDPNADIVFQSVKRFLSMPFPNHSFFESVYKNYEVRIRDEIVSLIKKVEDALPVMRQAYGMVVAPHNNFISGTMRVFDGTPRRMESIFYPEDIIESPVLPFEAIFKARNIKVNFIKKLEQMRIDDPYQQIFEIGKLSLEGSATVRDRSMKALEFFLLQYFLNRYPNAVIVVHVASEAHLKLYQKRYGFEVAESVTIPDTDQVEHILTLPADKFRTALKTRLGL